MKMVWPKMGTLLLLFVSFFDHMHCNTVLPIDLGESDSVSFNNFELLQNLLYRKTLQPKHVLELTFTNINLGSSQLQVFTQYNGTFTIERSITGTVGGSITATLHSADNAGVFVPKSTGTFKLTYLYKESCGQYCAVNSSTGKALIACGDIPGNHQLACLECKSSSCFVASVSPAKIPENILFGVTYCGPSLLARQFGCTNGRAVGSTCSFSCGGDNIPGTPGVSLIKSTCKEVSPGIGKWEDYPENFCLSQQSFLEICLSSNSDLGACNYDLNSMTESFGEEPATTTPATTTTTRPVNNGQLSQILNQLSSFFQELRKFLGRRS